MSISERLQHERTASDSGQVYVEHGKMKARFSHVFSCPNEQRSSKFWLKLWDRVIPGSVVLDYGCYEGDAAAKYIALKAKRVVGIDISPGAIERAKSLYGDHEFLVMDAHRMDFPDNSFDVVIGGAILHHLVFDDAIREVHRVLKPGGYAIFFEPLGDNPAAKLFRVLNPKSRTKDERPLSRKQIMMADRLFRSHEHRFFGLISSVLGVITSLIVRDRPDNIALVAADKIDVWLEGTPLRYWMRLGIFVWRK